MQIMLPLHDTAFDDVLGVYSHFIYSHFVFPFRLLFCKFFPNLLTHYHFVYWGFVCAEVFRPSQPEGVMSSTVSLPNHTFTGQA